jgi:hypothetical protein
MAVPSRDGSLVIFSSDWGDQSSNAIIYDYVAGVQVLQATSTPTPTPAPTLTPTPTPNPNKFSVGDRVQTTAKLQVRKSPCTNNGQCKVLGSQASGAKGTVIGGPTKANGYTWWNIKYDTGADGWSVENYLTKITVADAGTMSQPLSKEMATQLSSMGGVLPGSFSFQVQCR